MAERNPFEAMVAGDNPFQKYGGKRKPSAKETLADVALNYAEGVVDVLRPAVQSVAFGNFGRVSPANPLGLPTPQAVLAGGNALVDRFVKRERAVPETTPGRIARTAGQMTPNALAPGSAMARVTNVVAPTVGAEVAAGVTKAAGGDENAQQMARTVGGFLGGAAGSVRVNALRQEAPSAAQVLAKRAKLQPNALTAKAQELRAAGVEPTLTDVVGESGRRVIRAVGVKSETGGEALTNRAVEAKATVKPAVMAETRKLNPDPRTATQYADEVQAARDAKAQQDYAQFDAEPIEVPDTVKDMLADSAGRSIIARARADAIENQDWGRQVELDRLLRAADEGGVGPLPRISAGTIDRLVIAARERGRGFAEAGRNYRARGAFQRRDQLDATLANVEELKPARQAYSESSRAIEVARGENRLDPFSNDPADYAAWLQKLPPEARNANQIAIRQEILDTLGSQRANTFGFLDEIATSPYARENLRTAFGQAEADALIAQVQARLAQARNADFVQPNAGSRTGVLDADVQKVGDAVRDVAGTAFDIKTGNVRGLIERAVDMWRRRGISDQQAEELARIAVDPNQTDAAIQAIAAQLEPGARQQLIDLRRAALPGTAVLGAATAAPSSEDNRPFQ